MSAAPQRNARNRPDRRGRHHRGGRLPSSSPPQHAAFEHRDAAAGFEGASFRSRSGGTVVDGHTAAVEDGEPHAAGHSIELDANRCTRRARVHGRTGARRTAHGA
ncbi:putative glycolipid-binding domain-containing protein [Kineococcus indalonis]|uniref:putative glycolipid-binding domain-containing protein n=1 Tax=Kineococcus indalonis TaxID=2696566 RepID=UPI00141287C9|nr:putative glycolipid-binding domain-containing protein [Kineococcus indalonis]NAZ87699.1 hypothetical protein [Kineococcus indalonis]